MAIVIVRTSVTTMLGAMDAVDVDRQERVEEPRSRCPVARVQEVESQSIRQREDRVETQGTASVVGVPRIKDALLFAVPKGDML